MHAFEETRFAADRRFLRKRWKKAISSDDGGMRITWESGILCSLHMRMVYYTHCEIVILCILRRRGFEKNNRKRWVSDDEEICD